VVGSTVWSQNSIPYRPPLKSYPDTIPLSPINLIKGEANLKRIGLTLVKVCPVSKIKQGELLAFQVQGVDIVLTLLGGRIVAFQRWCTHEEGDLSMGMLEGGVIECPEHGAKFDLSLNGRNVLGPDEEEAGSVPDIRVFKTEVKDGNVYVEL